MYLWSRLMRVRMSSSEISFCWGWGGGPVTCNELNCAIILYPKLSLAKCVLLYIYGKDTTIEFLVWKGSCKCTGWHSNPNDTWWSVKLSSRGNDMRKPQEHMKRSICEGMRKQTLDLHLLMHLKCCSYSLVEM